MAARVRLWRLAVRVTAVLLLAPLPPILYLSHFGFPDRITRRLIDAADSEGYCLEMKGMRLDIFEGIVVDGPRLFRKGVLGLPAFEAGEVIVGFRILGAAGPQRIQRITIRNGKLRQAKTPRETPTEQPRARTAFPTLACRVHLENCDVHGLPFSRLSCNVLTRGSQLRIDNVQTDIGWGNRTGRLTADVSYNSADDLFTGHTASDFDPNDLVPFLRTRNMNGVISLVQSFAFPDRPPRMETSFAGRAGADFSLTVDGKVKVRGFRRYGLYVRQADSRVKVQLGGAREFVTLCPLVVARDDGSAEVDLTIDLTKNTVSFIGTGNADPRAVMRAIGPATADLLNDYHIGGPVTYSARGFLSTTNLDICDIEVTAEAKSFGLPRFVADDCSFVFRRKGCVTVISNLQARVFDGMISGAITFAPDACSTNTRFRASGSVDEVAFRTFAQALTGGNSAKEGLAGKLSGKVTAEGLACKDFGRTIDGKGSLYINDGNLLRLPLFGDLSDMLAKSVPGLGYVLRQDTASASFDIVHGKLRSDELRIEGDILSLKADGSYDMQTDQLDFDVELRFLRNKTWVGEILETVMLPVTKLFRVKLKGTTDNPRWTSVNF